MSQMPNTSLLNHLKETTSVQHKRVERQFGLLDPELNLQQYQAWLMHLYGYYAPLEEQLSVWSAALAINWEKRRKIPWLIRDLAYLGVSDKQREEQARCQALPPLTNIAEVFGALYVFEGSTLGGQFIAQHLAKRLQLNADQGAGFFLPYGSDPRPCWKAFQLRLLEVGSTPEQEARIITSACNTFESFESWLQSMPKSVSSLTQTDTHQAKITQF